MIVLLLTFLALSFSTSTAFAATNTSNINQLKTTTTSKLAAGSASSTVTYTQSQIADASNRVKVFTTNNNRLPNYVTIGNAKVTMPQFLQLMSQTVVNINSGSKASTTFKAVGNPSSIPKETVKSGKLYRANYVSLTNSILATINATGKAPNYKNIALGRINYQNMIFTLSNVLAYYKTSSKLPGYVSVRSWNTITGNSGEGKTSYGHGLLNGLSGTSGLQTLANYIHKYLNHQYGASTTAAGVESTGLGDCWGLSAWTAKVLHDNGYTVRIVQGASSEASNHRWDEVLINGKWSRFDPSLVTRHYNLPYYLSLIHI